MDEILVKRDANTILVSEAGEITYRRRTKEEIKHVYVLRKITLNYCTYAKKSICVYFLLLLFNFDEEIF